jgi:hypothetical protein
LDYGKLQSPFSSTSRLAVFTSAPSIFFPAEQTTMGNCWGTPIKDEIKQDIIEMQLIRTESDLSALQASTDKFSERKLTGNVDIVDEEQFSTNQDRIGKLKMRRSLLNSRTKEQIAREKRVFRMDQISRLDYLILAYSNHLEKLKQNHSQNGSLMKRCETRVEELKKQKVESQWILEEIRKNVKRT